MEWLDGLTYNKKLKTSFIIYMLIFLILGLSSNKIIEILIDWYVVEVQDLYFVEEVIKEGKEIITYYRLNPKGPTNFQISLAGILVLYKEFSLVINIFIFSVFGFSFYYKDKIKKPIDELKLIKLEIKNEKLLRNEIYKDEMLQFLSDNNEIIESLKIEKEKMWKELNEMEQMMASFEHDIRTPITIIRGYSDMILKYYPEGKMSNEKLEKTLISIGAQTNRLDEYIKRRTSLKSVNELELHVGAIETERILNNMERIGEALSTGKKFKIKNDLQSENLYLDENIVLEAYENILTNGFRYAQNIVEVTVKEDKSYLIIQVQDDGEGFSKEGLKYGTAAFFTENKSKGENMGLGLYISRKLCEKHMGKIKLFNNTKGGLVEIKFRKTIAVDK